MRKNIIKKINYIIFITFTILFVSFLNINIFNAQENNNGVVSEVSNTKNLNIDFFNAEIKSESNFKKLNTQEAFSKIYKITEQDYEQTLDFVFEGDESKTVQLEIPAIPEFDKEQSDNIAFTILGEDVVLDLESIKERIKNSEDTIEIYAYNKPTNNSFKSNSVKLVITYEYISHNQLKPIISGTKTLDKSFFSLTLKFKDEVYNLIDFQETVSALVSTRDDRPFSLQNKDSVISFQSFKKDIVVDDVKESIKIPTALELRKLANDDFKKQYAGKTGLDRYTYSPTFDIKQAKFNFTYRVGMTFDNYTLTLRNTIDYIWEDGTIEPKEVRQEYERDSIDNYQNFGIDFEKESIGYKTHSNTNLNFTVPAFYYVMSKNFKFYEEMIYGSLLNIKFENNKYIVIDVPTIKNFDPNDRENTFFSTYPSKDFFKSGDLSNNFYDEDFSYLKQNFITHAERKTPIYAYNKATNTSFTSKFNLYFVNSEVVEKKYNDFIISDNLKKENIIKDKIYIKNKYFINLYPNDFEEQIYSNFHVSGLEKQDDRYRIDIEDEGNVIGSEHLFVKIRNSVLVPNKNQALDRYNDFLDNPSSIKYSFELENSGNIIIVKLILNDKENDVFNNNKNLTIDDITYVYNLSDYVNVNYSDSTITSNYNFSIITKSEDNTSAITLAENTNNFNFQKHYGKKLNIKLDVFSSRVYFYINLNGGFNPNEKTTYIFDDVEYEDITKELYEKLKNSFLNKENKKIKRYNPLLSPNPNATLVENDILFTPTIIIEENTKIYSFDNLENKVSVNYNFVLENKVIKTELLEKKYYSLNSGLVNTIEGKIKVTVLSLDQTTSFDHVILKKPLPILNKDNFENLKLYFNITQKEDKTYIIELKNEYKDNVEIQFDEKIKGQKVNKLSDYSYTLNLLSNNKEPEKDNNEDKIDKENQTTKKSKTDIIVLATILPISIISLIGVCIFVYFKKIRRK